VAGYGVALAGLGYYNFPKQAAPSPAVVTSSALPAEGGGDDDDDKDSANPLLARDKNSEDDEEAGSAAALRHGKDLAAVQVPAFADQASASRRSGRVA
jgi:hypothetical protein